MTTLSGLPAPARRGRARRAAAAGALVVAAALALTLGAGPLAGGAGAAAPGPKPDPVAGADQTVAQLRRQADAASGRYFAELSRFNDLDRAVTDLEARIPELEARARRLRAKVRLRAVAAYEQANGQLAAIVDSSDALELARKAKLLDQLNARDDGDVAQLNASVADLSRQRDELRSARQAEQAALDEVRRQGDAINATLTAAVDRQRTLHAAAAAAAARTTTSTTVARAASPTTRPSKSNAPATPAPSSPPPAPASYTPTPGVHPHHDDPFLTCTRARESSGRYNAYNPAGPYYGAYQMLQATWNGAANHAGRTDLIGVPPSAASPYDQDDVAWALYQWQGKGPWGGNC